MAGKYQKRREIVRCLDCRHEWLKRASSIKRWQGRCVPCALKHWRGRPATREERHEFKRLYNLAFPEKRRASEKRRIAKNPLRYRKTQIAWYKKNREHRSDYGRKWYQKNKARVCKATRDWAKNNPNQARERARRYMLKRRHSDIGFKILGNLRSRLRAAIKGSPKAGRTIQLLGCSITSFKMYIESNFEPGMTWENHGNGYGKWNLDHKMPCSIFDLSKPSQQRACFHFSNLEPMWWIENVRKSNKILEHKWQ